MRSKKIASPLLEKFERINSAGKSPSENDAIMVSVMNEITSTIKSFFCRERERAMRNALKEEYLLLLKEIRTIVREQENIISQIDCETDAGKLVDTLFALKKEMEEYTERLVAWEYSYNDKIFSEQERTIVKWTRLYDNIDKYTRRIKMYDAVSVKNDAGITPLSNWKTCFFLWIGMEKQKDSRQIFMLDYKERKAITDTEELLKSRNALCAMDFHCHLSKSVYNQRKKLNLTQLELARKSGVDRSMIAKIESLYQPTTVETAVKLVTALDMGIAIYPLAESFAKDNKLQASIRGGV